jgi:type VI secretion system protein ImpI
MFLILEVTSSNAPLLGAASRAVFTAAGGSIGRRPGNDWVLPDPHVSGRHARVRAIGGTFFLEDNESANGVTVNGGRLHPGEPFPLKDGDKVFIDPFEMTVTVSMVKPGASTEVTGMQAAPAQVPLAPIPLTPSPPAYAAGGGLLDDIVAAPAGFGDIVPEAGGALPSDFNPLLDEPPPAAAPAYTGAHLQSKPVIHDAFDIPAPRTPAPPAGGQPGSVIPTNWDALDLMSPEPAAPVVTPAPPRPQPPPAAPVVPPPVAARPPVSPVAPVPSPTPIAGNANDLASLLRAAGVSEQAASPEVMEEFGLVLRIVIEGLMEVLRARGEIRSEFRLPQTSFKPRDNNPLKMAVNAEDAVHNLLVKRNPAYLGTTAAFDDAFKDVRHHQLAMLAGMRAAYAYMLQRFDPVALKAQFDARPARKGFSFSTQGKYWEAFEEYYRETTADGDDCFRRLFGDQFARAYEEQIQLLRSARDRTKSQT